MITKADQMEDAIEMRGPTYEIGLATPPNGGDGSTQNGEVANRISKEIPTPCNQFFDPITVADLLSKEVQKTEYVIEHIAVPGHFTVLASPPKTGKTTYLADVVRKHPEIRTLYVTEESEALWKDRCIKLGLGEQVEFLSKPFMGSPTGHQWEVLAEEIAAAVPSRGYQVVIFDTFANLSPAFEENAAEAMQAALMPLNQIAAAGPAVFLAHHLRKSSTSVGGGIRGSSVLAGFPDIIVELHRFSASMTDRRRKLKILSRFDDAPAEIVLDLRDDGYHTLDSPQDAGRKAFQAVILPLLPKSPPGLEAKEIREQWPSTPKPDIQRLRRELTIGINAGLWSRGGDGKKNSPYRYSSPTTMKHATVKDGIGAT